MKISAGGTRRRRRAGKNTMAECWERSIPVRRDVTALANTAGGVESKPQLVKCLRVGLQLFRKLPTLDFHGYTK